VIGGDDEGATSLEATTRRNVIGGDDEDKTMQKNILESTDDSIIEKGKVTRRHSGFLRATESRGYSGLRRPFFFRWKCEVQGKLINAAFASTLSPATTEYASSISVPSRSSHHLFTSDAKSLEALRPTR